MKIKFNEYLNESKIDDMKITFEGRGNTFFQHESSVLFNINGEDYWFTMIEKGNMDNAPNGTEVDFISDDELPFDITEEMKDEMYKIVSNNGY